MLSLLSVWTFAIYCIKLFSMKSIFSTTRGRSLSVAKDLCCACRPVYKPSEDRLTYAAVHTLPLDSNSLRIAGGAVNTFLAQHLEADSSGEAPLLLTAADIKDSLTLSDVSLYIDAAFVPSKQPIRRWLQASMSTTLSLQEKP